jgi:hypothetical protein
MPYPSRRSARAIFLAVALTGAAMAGACSPQQNVSPALSNARAARAMLSVTVSPLEAGSTIRIVLSNASKTTPIARPAVALAPWLDAIARRKRLRYAGTIPPGGSRTLSFSLAANRPTERALFVNYQYVLSNPASKTLAVTSPSLGAAVLPQLDVRVAPTATYQTLLRDVLFNADMWDTKPEIMSAGYGFEGIEGVGTIAEQNPTQSETVAAGGAWESIATAGAPANAYTTATSPMGVAIAFGYPTYLADAMPVCFSWPVLPSTVSRKNFAISRSDGSVVQPYVASITPNFEYNERACVVIFGSFGNRVAPGYPGGIYPTRVTIVRGDAPLMLVGPNGPVSAVGLSKESTNPYAVDGGPTMNAAKLSVMSTKGEQAPAAFSNGMPNDCVAYYGSSIQYRLRTFSTGGTSPDGVAAILPTDFATYFKIQVRDGRGKVRWITKAGTVYTFAEGTIEVVGLADLGKAQTPLDDAYVADRDNQIDICLKGSRAAMRLITGVETVASGAYLPFYNPGGPGNDPTSGVTYTQPGKSQFVPVIQALDDPMTVTYPAKDQGP